jgi:hypothetical protein
MVSSPLMTSDCERQMPDYAAHIDRFAARGRSEQRPPDLPAERGDRSPGGLA